MSEASGQTRSLGIDVSAWQGNISQTTWNNIHNVENRDFVFIRSSRGGTTGFYNQSNASNTNPPGQNTLSQRYDDPYFVQNITRATAAGLFAGSYHFARPDIIESTPYAGGIANTGTDEADHFIQMAGAWMRPGYLLPVLDLEAGISQRTPNQMAQFAIDFSDRVYDVMSVRPAIYIGTSYSVHLQNSSLNLRNQVVSKMPVVWHPRWPNEDNPNSIPVQEAHPGNYTPTIYGPWDDSGTAHPWSFWQYTASGRLNSFNNGNSNLDFNVAQGGVEFLKDNLVPALWMSDSSGDWSTLANWNSGQTPVAPVQGPGQVPRVGALTLPAVRLPAGNDTIILDRPNADITVTLSSGTHSVRKLYAREELNITGGSLNIGYVPVADSTPISAQFSADVSLGGEASLSVHTLQVDATRTFTLDGGSFTFNKVNLIPHASAPATLLLSGDVTIIPLDDAPAAIVNTVGPGNSGRIDFGGGNRVITVGDGAAATDLTVSVPLVNGGLTKSGPGTMHITNNSLLTGDTVVNEGTLRINTPFLSNSADLYLNANGILDLNFSSGTPDVINSLFIDGVMQSAGTWGSLESSAQYTSALIAGSGLLQVTTSPIPGDFNGDGSVDGDDLIEWQNSYGVDDGGDANGDGITDGRDFLIWQKNFTGPNTLTATSMAIPEPSTMVLFGLVSIGLLCRRR